jgi:hypothetical protein
MQPFVFDNDDPALPHIDIGGQIDWMPQAISFMKRAKCERGV